MIDVYDDILLVQILKGTHSGSALSEFVPMGKVAVRQRLRALQDIDMIKKSGRTKGAKWSLTEKGELWLQKNGHMKQ